MDWISFGFYLDIGWFFQALDNFFLKKNKKLTDTGFLLDGFSKESWMVFGLDFGRFLSLDLG
jgi:hypothetical protein